MIAQVEGTRRWLPGRAFWLGALVADLILLFFLSQVHWLALALALLAVATGFLLHVEWLLAFLLLGMPFLAPLPLDENAFTLILVLLRALFVAGWWVALRREAGAVALGFGARRVSAAACLRRLLRDPITITVLLLALWVWIGLGWSPAPRYGNSKTTALFLGNLFLFAAPFLLWMRWTSPLALDRFLRAAIVLGTIFAAFGIASAAGFAEQLSFGALVRVQLITRERLAWLGVSQIWTARMLAVWLVLVLWGAQRRLVRPALAVLLVLVALFLIARTGSRGPLAALLLAPVSLLLLPRARLRRPPGRWRRLLPVAVPSAILAAFLIVTLLPEQQRTALVAGLLRGPIGMALSASDLGEGATEALGVRLAQDPSTAHRMHLARRSLATLPGALPWGAGTGAFPMLLFLRDFRLYPHNIFAELLIENGWPGLLLFLALVLWVWRACWQLARRTPIGRWLFLLFAMALLNAQVSGDLGTNEWIWLWAGLAGGMRAAHDRERSVVGGPWLAEASGHRPKRG
ncbi:MAG: hypothetical protein GF330_02145 [Candidatus Eisenbacteria bacterium]|nr:hypothetical protein [Candidatus Eisenbacteria bacterium]